MEGRPPARSMTIIVLKHGRVSPPKAAATAAPTYVTLIALIHHLDRAI